MQVELTDFAIQQLAEIHSYYAEVASEKVALKVTNNILDSIETLEQLPTIGSREPYLAEMELKHKFIVSGNYKIIFRKEENAIYVTDIFDGRQDPSKITDRNK